MKGKFDASLASSLRTYYTTTAAVSARRLRGSDSRAITGPRTHHHLPNLANRRYLSHFFPTNSQWHMRCRCVAFHERTLSYKRTHAHTRMMKHSRHLLAISCNIDVREDVNELGWASLLESASLQPWRCERSTGRAQGKTAISHASAFPMCKSMQV